MIIHQSLIITTDYNLIANRIHVGDNFLIFVQLIEYKGDLLGFDMTNSLYFLGIHGSIRLCEYRYKTGIKHRNTLSVWETEFTILEIAN